MNTRIATFQKNLQFDAFLFENPVDIFYLAGVNISSGKLIVSRENAWLLVDARYYEMCKKKNGIKTTLLTKEALNTAFKGFKKTGFDGAFLSYEGALDLKKELPFLEWISEPSPLKCQRAIKSADEILLLKEAASLSAEGFDLVCKLLSEGIQENEILLHLDIFWKKQGGNGLSFDPIIAFGENSSMPHYRAGEARLKKGDTVLIDIGVIRNHYHSDMTRTVFFYEPHEEMKKIYPIVKKAQEEALAALKPGVKIGDVDLAARGYIESQGWGSHFTHSLGHGLGLEIHEWPFFRNKPPYADIALQEGMCLTIEPGIYIEGVGGVRIEDTVVITKDGYKNLTKRPTEMKIIHA